MGFKKANEIVLQGQFASTNPVDATAYYFGNAPTAMLTVDNIYTIVSPVKGTIKAASVWTYAGTPGTNEEWEWFIRVDLANTSLGKVTSASARRLWVNYNLNIPVDVGSFLQFYTLCPTWVTNAALMFGTANIVIQY